MRRVKSLVRELWDRRRGRRSLCSSSAAEREESCDDTGSIGESEKIPLSWAMKASVNGFEGSRS